MYNDKLVYKVAFFGISLWKDKIALSLHKHGTLIQQPVVIWKTINFVLDEHALFIY